MEFDDIEKILALVREHDLAEFELERDGLKLKVKKAHGPGPGIMPAMHAPSTMPPMPSQVSMGAPATTTHATPPAGVVEDEVELAVVKSPIVGAASFVEVGQRVKKDQVLCIIEAMKLMNEITSEYDGELVSAYVENGKPVQYGERLFAIKTS